MNIILKIAKLFYKLAGMTKEDAYKILEIESSATPDEINKKFKQLSKQHHPDKGGSTPKYQEISEAYHLLKNKSENPYDNIYESPGVQYYDFSEDDYLDDGPPSPEPEYEPAFDEAVIKVTDSILDSNDLGIPLIEVRKICNKFGIEHLYEEVVEYIQFQMFQEFPTKIDGNFIVCHQGPWTKAIKEWAVIKRYILNNLTEPMSKSDLMNKLNKTYRDYDNDRGEGLLLTQGNKEEERVLSAIIHDPWLFKTLITELINDNKIKVNGNILEKLTP